jgi:hypothetical protein
MAEWLYDKSGTPRLIVDTDCIRDSRGIVIAWVHGNGLFSMRGQHVGWFERGVAYDRNNNVLGFVPTADGYLPYRPGIAGAPGMPGFAGRPGRPGLSGMFGRPGCGGWSATSLHGYFAEI